MRLLLFAGTTEGRLLARALAQMPGVAATVCVATEYGRQALGDFPAAFTVEAGRLDRDGMEALMRGGGFHLAVDATHPYAAGVTGNIRAAAQAAGVPLLRLLRAEGEAQGSRCFSSVEQAAQALCRTGGNVLITTGSKELAAYTKVPDYARRLYPRVLPTRDAIEACERLGFAGSHIIAMQGPFSRALNAALMEQFRIRVLVTKDGGAAGGFAEKLEAALERDVEVLVVGRPLRETGSTLDEVLDEVRRRGEGSA